nr:MAG TPA: hypothetical protein [Caudoviricetes sp.]
MLGLRTQRVMFGCPAGNIAGGDLVTQGKTFYFHLSGDAGDAGDE